VSRIAAILIAIAAVNTGWHITFAADPANDHVQMDTTCYEQGRMVWSAVDSLPITPGSTGMTVRRHLTPATALCDINVFLFKKGAENPSEDAHISE
jgi:hypothetical protein